MTVPDKNKELSQGRPLRVAFLVGRDDRPTRMSIEAVCQIPGVQPVAVLLDTQQSSLLKRVKNLRRNIRKEGWHYAPARLLEALRAFTDVLADRAVVSRAEVLAVLRKAFPEQCFSLEEAGSKHGFVVRKIGNLNDPLAIKTLQECDVDLGIVLGTRILKPTTFAVPRMGCINLHKGKVPEYRGMPPGFWELYDGVSAAGVTVHHVASQLDAGDIVETSEVPISPRDTPETLLARLHEEGTRTLARAVAAIQAGTAQRRPQTEIGRKPRSKPAMRDIAVLCQKLPHWEKQSDWAVLGKNAISLLIYCSGLYTARRKWRRNSRAVIYVHHRVNDYANDKISVDTECFTAQLLAIAKRYPTMSSSELVECIRQKKRIAPTTVVIHFDDAYRDVSTTGRPVLKTIGLPATAFVSSGYVDTDRAFPHDAEKYPFRFENYRSSDLRDWVADGFEIGSHTVNHVDLAKCSLEDARYEICACAAQLRERTGRTVDLMSFPYGTSANIRSEVVDYVKQAGYKALFSAYGGFVGKDTDIWDIPRMGVNGKVRPLYLLLEIEALWRTTRFEAM